MGPLYTGAFGGATWWAHAPDWTGAGPRFSPPQDGLRSYGSLTSHFWATLRASLRKSP